MISSSLLIATYNWPQALESCLLSVMKQHQLPSEVIIADDGSGDETKTLVEQFRQKFPVPLKHIWHPDEGFRLGMIRNKAMAAASGDYLVQVDGDLVLHPFFIDDHLSAARPGYFIGGSRVLLNQSATEKILYAKNTAISVFDKGVNNKLNGLHAPALARLIEFFKKEKGLYNMRGCNMSFWKKDILSVNGYNENISGWGREDTEMAIRFYNKGYKRRYFKLQGIVYHLFHQEADRSGLMQNDEILKATKADNLIYCANGINKYL
ncbi:MAG: glycosyltransferase family 2 protein [Flavitalea sp.]